VSGGLLRSKGIPTYLSLKSRRSIDGLNSSFLLPNTGRGSAYLIGGSSIGIIGEKGEPWGKILFLRGAYNHRREDVYQKGKELGGLSSAEKMDAKTLL